MWRLPFGLVIPLIVLAALACTTEAGQETGAVSGETPASTPVAAQPSPSPPPPPTPTPQGPQRIVAAAPGAVAEAEGVRVTLNEVRDPVVSQAQFAPTRPEPGKRFVAFDATIERVSGPGDFVSCYDFKLIDAAGFVYEHDFLASLATREAGLSLLRGVNIGSGEKVRGWCSFQVGADAKLAVLKYDPNFFTTSDIEFRFQ